VGTYSLSRDDSEEILNIRMKEANQKEGAGGQFKVKRDLKKEHSSIRTLRSHRRS